MSIGAIDIGGTNVRYAYGDSQGNIHSEVLEEDLESDLKTQIKQIVEYLEEETDLDELSIATTGVTSEEKIERLNFVEPGRMEEIDLSGLGYRTNLNNDANLGALGEYISSDEERILYVTFSTGIGAGLVNEGNIMEGREGNAIKIGAYPLKPKFSSVTEKTEGAWEDLCGGKGIADFTELISDGEHRFSPKELYVAASDNEEAREYVEQIGRLNAQGLATAALSFDPDEIVLGGSIALENPEIFLESIESEFPRYFPEDYKSPDIRLASRGKNSELVGALAYTGLDMS